MSNHILEIIKEYDALKQAAKDDQLKRQTEIYTKLYRMKEIDDAIASAGFEIASAVIKGTLDDGFILKRKTLITDLKMEKAELLTGSNYPINYMEIKYKCSKCNDTGYVGSTKCSCFKQKLIDKNYEQSNLKNILKLENFETFDMSLYSSDKYPNESISPRKNMEYILTKCMQYTENFDSTNENLFFYGGSGLGKTFLSNCISNDLLQKGKVVIYQTSSNLIDILRNLRFSDEASKEQINDFVDCDLLIIDDLGTEPSTAYSQSELFNIINSRLLNNKETIISTNYQLDDIVKNYPERICSRIFGRYTGCKFYGNDIRRLKKSKRGNA